MNDEWIKVEYRTLDGDLASMFFRRDSVDEWLDTQYDARKHSDGGIHAVRFRIEAIQANPDQRLPGESLGIAVRRSMLDDDRAHRALKHALEYRPYAIECLDRLADVANSHHWEAGIVRQFLLHLLEPKKWQVDMTKVIGLRVHWHLCSVIMGHMNGSGDQLLDMIEQPADPEADPEPFRFSVWEQQEQDRLDEEARKWAEVNEMF